jgi:hypothetical protein
MQGFIAVTANRSVVTGGDGSFEVRDVPAGAYDVTVWHEVLQAQRAKVTVAAGQVAEMTISLVRR